MKFYNMMSSAGFDKIMGFDFFMSWIGLAILVLVGAIAKKWLGEEEVAGYPYNWLGSILGVIVYIFVISLFGSYKIALVSGLIGMFIGGFGSAIWLGGTDE